MENTKNMDRILKNKYTAKIIPQGFKTAAVKKCPECGKQKCICGGK